MAEDPAKAAERHTFTATSFLIWSALLIYMTNFLFVYVFGALACARQFADVRLLGMSVVLLVTVASSALAIGATAWLVWRAYQQSSREHDEHSSFIRFVAFATGILALIGLLYLALPPLLLARGCEGGA